MTEHEYVVVHLIGGSTRDGEKKLTEQVNGVAQYGWRLVTVDENKAYFERAKAPE